jgi:hypothetical protein
LSCSTLCILSLLPIYCLLSQAAVGISAAKASCLRHRPCVCCCYSTPSCIVLLGHVAPITEY